MTESSAGRAFQTLRLQVSAMKKAYLFDLYLRYDHSHRWRAAQTDEHEHGELK